MSNWLCFSVVGAIFLFWGIGAYNRLVRLRVAAIQAFSPLHAHYEQCVTLVQISFGTAGEERRVGLRSALLGAADQFLSSLKVAQVRPLDVPTLCALQSAHGILFDCWTQVSAEPADLAGAVLPETLQHQWLHLGLQVADGLAEFNRRVQTYNHAIAQYPACWLARVFGFGPAHVLKTEP